MSREEIIIKAFWLKTPFSNFSSFLRWKSRFDRRKEKYLRRRIIKQETGEKYFVGFAQRMKWNKRGYIVVETSGTLA